MKYYHKVFHKEKKCEKAKHGWEDK